MAYFWAINSESSMIRSMTGFGSASVQTGNKTISAEIKSVNSKYFDLSLRLPSAFRDKELELRGELNRSIERGKVECMVAMQSSEPQRKATFDMALLKSYNDELLKVKKELQIEETPDLFRTLLTMPDVFVNEKEAASETEWEGLQDAVRKATEVFNSFRKNEGKSLSKDMEHRIGLIRTCLSNIEPFEKARLETTRNRLLAGLEEHVKSPDIDRNRFEQELIYYIEKLDITEEKVRLSSHCDYFLETMKDESSGKKLSFIAQEIGREINTIGSKSNDAGMQKLVVEMKDELEKIKEQVLNVI